MANKPTPPPQRTFSFTDFSTNSPSAQQPGDKLDGSYDTGFTYATQLAAWVSTTISDTGALKSGVVYKSNVDPTLYQSWENDLLTAVQPSVDSALASAGSAQNSAQQAASSESAVEDSAISANQSSQSAATSAASSAAAAQQSAQFADVASNEADRAEAAQNAAGGDASAAQLSEQASFLWAEFMDGPVRGEGNTNPNPAVGDGYYSARWWANYASQVVNSGTGVDEKSFIITLNAGNGTAEDDLNNTDFTSQTGGACINITSGSSYVFSHGNNLYKYLGPVGVCLGLNGTHTVLDAELVPTGSSVHNDLTGRDTPDAHPLAAITGLQTALNNKSDTDHTHDAASLPNAGWVEKTGDEMTGDLVMRPVAADDPSAIIMHDKEDRATGGMVITDGYSYSGDTDELMLLGEELDPVDPGEPAVVGIRLKGSYIALDADQLTLGLPNAEAGAGLIVNGLTLNGDAIVGLSAAPPSDYEVSATNNMAEVLQDGAGTGLPYLLCTLNIAEDIAAGEAVTYTQAYITQTSSRTGSIEMGYSVNGGAINWMVSYMLGANYAGYVTYSAPNAIALNNGDTAEIYLRATGDHNQTEIWHRGDLNISSATLRRQVTSAHNDMQARDAADAHPIDSITDLRTYLTELGRVAINTHSQNFNVLIEQLRPQIYFVTAPVTCTIPAGLLSGEQFTVFCQSAGVLFNTAQYSNILLPQTKSLFPFEAGSSITFTVLDPDTLLVSGDLADL